LRRTVSSAADRDKSMTGIRRSQGRYLEQRVDAGGRSKIHGFDAIRDYGPNKKQGKRKGSGRVAQGVSRHGVLQRKLKKIEHSNG